MEYLKKKEKYDRSKEQIVETSWRKDQNDLTVQDARLPEGELARYDAFILFDENDIDFGTEMINKVEGFGFKVQMIFFHYQLHCNTKMFVRFALKNEIFWLE